MSKRQRATQAYLSNVKRRRRRIAAAAAETVDLSDAFFAAAGATAPWYAHATQYNSCHHNGKTYVTWETYEQRADKRFVQIRAFTHATGLWGRVYTVGPASVLNDDDHGVPSLCVNADGRLVVAWGNHNGNFQLAVSTAAEDESNWTQGAALSGRYTYPHLVLSGTTVYCLLRKDIQVGDATFPNGAMILVARPITFVGATPTIAAEIEIANFGNASRWYQGNMVLTSGRIAQVACRADYGDTFRRDVHYYEIDFANSRLQNFAGATVAFPVGLTDMNTSFRLRTTAGTDSLTVPQLCIDDASRRHILFAEGVTDSNDMPAYHMIGSAGSFGAVAAIPDAIDRPTPIMEADGTMAVYWVDDPAASETFPAGGNVYRKYLPSGGGTGDWGAAELLQTFDATRWPLFSTSIVFNADPEIRVIWSESGTSSDDEDSFPYKRLYAHGDEGFKGKARTTAAEPVALAGTGYWIEAHPDYCYSDVGMTTLSGVGGLVRAIKCRFNSGNNFILEGSEPKALREDDGYYWVDMGDSTPTTSYACAAFTLPQSNAYWAAVAARAWNSAATTMDILIGDDGSGGDRVFRLAYPASLLLAAQPFSNAGVGATSIATTKLVQYNDDFVLGLHVNGTAGTGYHNGDQIGTTTVGSVPDTGTAIHRIGANGALASTSYMRERFTAAIARGGNIDLATRQADMAYLASLQPR